MRLEWWMHAPYRKGIKVEDEASLFDPHRFKKVIVLVESEAEYDLTYALQFIYGGTVEIKIFKDNTEDIWPYLDVFSRVYTSWDPFDRNRI